MHPRSVRAFTESRENVLKVLEDFGAVQPDTRVLDMGGINATYIFPVNVPPEGADQFHLAVKQAGGIFLNGDGRFSLGPDTSDHEIVPEPTNP